MILDDGQISLDADTEEMTERSYAVTGPQKEVDAYTSGLNVIGKESLGGIQTNYVYGELDDDRVIPDTVKIQHVDLQKLFVYLTRKENQHDVLA